MKPITKTCVLAAGLAGCVLAAGCGDVTPKPSQDAVVYYLTGARLHGKVRVCWPEGQRYVTGITTADAKLAKLLAPLRALLDPGALWPPDDPRWHNVQALTQRAKELAGLLNDDARKRRREALDALRTAIDDIPPSLGLTDQAARQAFKKRIWTALAVNGRPLEKEVAALESVAAAYRDLYAKAAKCAGGGKPDPTADFGCADPACRQELTRLYERAREAVAAEYRRFLDHANARMAVIRETIGTLDKKKQRDEYLLLDNERTYYKRVLERRIRKVQSLIRRTEHDLRQARKASGAAGQRRVAFLEHQLKRYHDLFALTQREKNEIVEGPAAAQSAPAASP